MKNETTHLLKNSCSSIGLIFTSNPSLGMKSGALCSSHKNFNHQIVYAKWSLKTCYSSSF